MGASLSSLLGVPAVIPESLDPTGLSTWLRLTLLVVWSETGAGKEAQAQTKGKASCCEGKSHQPRRALPTAGPSGVRAALLVWLGQVDPSLFAPAPRQASPKVPDLVP